MTGWWFGTFLFFHDILYGIILPIDFHLCQDGYCTTNQMTIKIVLPASIKCDLHGRALAVLSTIDEN